MLTIACDTPSVPRVTAHSIRDRARAQMVRHIKKLALKQLHEVGAGGISLRQIARDLHMVSSAVYRYFPSRDDLLTALIIDAYDAVGDQAEKTRSAVLAASPREQWLSVCRSMRAWARAHPDQYALIYGSPLPGYHAPVNTVSPAARVALVLVQVLADRLAQPPSPEPHQELSPALAIDLARLRAETFPLVPEPLLAAVLAAWTQLLGSISLELFGHLRNVVEDFDALFEYEMELMVNHLGL
jgi:AcrR family transcriptional regulator